MKSIFLLLRRIIVLFIFFAGLVIFPGCESMHSAKHAYFMQGKILSVEDGNIVACIGDKQGAKVGQELGVVQHKAIRKIAPHGSMNI